MRILELGQYVAPAYAGMLLAEQGHDVIKWWGANDPILSLHRGDELWAYLNHGKRLEREHASAVARDDLSGLDIVIDNFRADAWERWQIDPGELAQQYGLTWVSLRDDFDGRSFDAIAQARAFGDLGSTSFYLGDTAVGLMLAFKALAAAPGHHVVRQAAALAKLVEGEGVVERDQPWDAPGTYERTSEGARVDFRGEIIEERNRDTNWRLQHLAHKRGRFVL